MAKFIRNHDQVMQFIVSVISTLCQSFSPQTVIPLLSQGMNIGEMPSLRIFYIRVGTKLPIFYATTHNI